MRTPFPRKRGGGGRANLGWAQTGERPERGGEEGGGPHTVAHRRGGKRNRGIGVNLRKCHVGSFLSAFCIVPSPQRAPPSPLLPPPFRVSPLSQPPLSHCPFPGAPHPFAPPPPFSSPPPPPPSPSTPRSSFL